MRHMTLRQKSVVKALMVTPDVWLSPPSVVVRLKKSEHAPKSSKSAVAKTLRRLTRTGLLESKRDPEVEYTVCTNDIDKLRQGQIVNTTPCFVYRLRMDR